MKDALLTTDGACLGNPGPGGWGFVLRHDGAVFECSGGNPYTTNNRMELAAVIEGLKALSKPCQVVVTTDSKYVCNGTNLWLKNWKKQGGMKKGTEPVANWDLWLELDAAHSPHSVRYDWVKGHGVHVDNLRSDQLASEAAHRASEAAAMRKSCHESVP